VKTACSTRARDGSRSVIFKETLQFQGNLYLIAGNIDRNCFSKEDASSYRKLIVKNVLSINFQIEQRCMMVDRLDGRDNRTKGI